MPIRKHKGINQRTGKLKKGYKYIGKKTKSGLSIIQKVKQKGGKVLGEGSFGCVIKPYVPCDEKDKNKKNMVSKIILNEKEFDPAEIKIGEKLLKYDPENKYTIYVTKTCKIDSAKINKKDSSECNINNNSKVYNLNMKEGGITLFDFFQKHTKVLTVENIAQIIGYLLKGLNLLLKNGITHYDIKPINILIVTKNKKIHPVFIDFGNFNPMNYEEFKNAVVSKDDKYLWPKEVIKQMRSFGDDIQMKNNAKNSFIPFSNKVMVFMVGRMFNYHTNKKIKNIILKMTDIDYNKRLDVNKSLALISEIFPNIDMNNLEIPIPTLKPITLTNFYALQKKRRKKKSLKNY